MVPADLLSPMADDLLKKRGLLQSHESTVSNLQRLADALIIVGAQYIACAAHGERWRQVNTLAVATGIAAFHLISEMNGLYRSWRGTPMKREALHAVTTWAAVAPILLMLAFFTKTTDQFSRVISTVWFMLTPAMLVAWRVSVRVGLMTLRRRGFNVRHVAIVGATPMGMRIAAEIRSDPCSGMHVLGFYDDRDRDRLERALAPAETLRGNLERLLEEAKSGNVDRVYITLPLKAETRIADVVRKLADTTADVYAVADFLVFDLLHAQWSTLGDIPVVSIFDTPIHGVSGWLKRLEDLVLGSVIVAIIAVPMALIAIGVKLTSSGPIFFRQRRYGLNGREIRVLKFRTMSVLEDGGEVKQAMRNDPRVTRFGAFLRQSSLDELPQFLQVLTGEMSIVGPRPHAVSHNELYRSKIQGYMLRHKVKPGITGWAQVNGWRGETDTLDKMVHRVDHDLEYIHNWRLFWDIKIILSTIFGSKKRQNAY